MSNVFSLDSLRQEADKAFAPLQVTLADGSEVVLRNLLRLGKTAREDVSTLLDHLKELQDAEESGLSHVNQMSETIEQILQLAADRGPELLAELDGDLATAMQVLNTWMSSTQAGEAENSPA